MDSHPWWSSGDETSAIFWESSSPMIALISKITALTIGCLRFPHKPKNFYQLIPVEVIGLYKIETSDGELHRPELLNPEPLSPKKTKKSMHFPVFPGRAWTQLPGGCRPPTRHPELSAFCRRVRRKIHRQFLPFPLKERFGMPIF